ncbi:Protein FAR1-RELATED SEQUENCE 5, partial [Bienertia sinuspersici]
ISRIYPKSVEQEAIHHPLQSENENEVEHRENKTPNKCKLPMSTITEWVPACEENMKPKEGLEFNSLEECEKFYKTYAHHVGFSVCRSSTKIVKKTGLLKYKTFVCAKEGFREAKYASK